MSVVQVAIHRREPYAAGAAFGGVGPYEQLDGTLTYAVEPAHPANVAIVDLDKAPVDAEGRVRFTGDFCPLQPVDPQRGSGRLLLDVPNRGRPRAVPMFNHARAEPTPAGEIAPGDGFLMRHGWTVVTCGWQWDVPRTPELLGLAAPMAGQDGAPIQGQAVVEWQPNAPCRVLLLANRLHHPYPAGGVNDPAATLTVREWMDGPRTTIPRDRWRFARDEDGAPAPDDTRVWMQGGFEPGRLYELVYRTRLCPVVGAGLLAVRDCASFLRYGASGTDKSGEAAAVENPCAGRIERAYAFGVSQTGRFLRHFLYLGLNLDEASRQVFDGLLPHVAGARRGEFNHRFAQPSAQAVRGFGHLPPFAFEGVDEGRKTKDESAPTGSVLRPSSSVTTGGLLDRQRALGAVPKIIATNTAAEYWRGDCSLLHTDFGGEHDVKPPAEVRIYYFAGTQHGPGTVPPGRVSAADGQRGVHDFNTVDYTPLLRAALANLDRWVATGDSPPPSVFPRLHDHTAARARDVLAALRAIPGMTLPKPERLDLGPDAGAGIGRHPAIAGEPYPAYVSAVDGDGNETGGVRLPDLAVPLATYTGWNPRDPATGGAGQIVNMQGSTIPFPKTADDRERGRDPRLAIAERYHDRDDYLGRVRAAAEELVAHGYLLEEDVPLVVGLAAERYAHFAAAPAPVTT